MTTQNASLMVRLIARLCAFVWRVLGGSPPSRLPGDQARNLEDRFRRIEGDYLERGRASSDTINPPKPPPPPPAGDGR